MADILRRIVEYKVKEVEENKRKFDLKTIIEEAEKLSVKRDFKAAFSKNEINIIAEVKRASPSKGIIRDEDFDPVDMALNYEKGGAKAVSVLTDKKFFQGSPYFLRQIAQVVKIPVLRKDFIVDEFQVYGAKVLGASSFLLITSILSDNQLRDFILLGRELGMEPLVEVHTEKDVYRAIRCGADIIGINNRNLETFEVDLETTINLLPLVKESGKICVSESGIKNRLDIDRLRACGVDGFLIGEALMKSDNPAKVLKKWVS